MVVAVTGSGFASFARYADGRFVPVGSSLAWLRSALREAMLQSGWVFPCRPGMRWDGGGMKAGLERGWGGEQTRAGGT